MTPRAPPKKVAGGRLVLIGEICDCDGSNRPENLADTHSLQWANVGFGPAAFNAISPAFFCRYLATPTLVIHLHPAILLGVQNNEWRSSPRTSQCEMPNAIIR